MCEVKRSFWKAVERFINEKIHKETHKQHKLKWPAHLETTSRILFVSSSLISSGDPLDTSPVTLVLQVSLVLIHMGENGTI